MQRRQFLRNGLLLGAAGAVPGTVLAANNFDEARRTLLADNIVKYGIPSTRTGLVLPSLDDSEMYNLLQELLAYAIRIQHLELVKSFVEQGADVHAYAGQYWTPLHRAVWAKSIDIVKYLVSRGADVNAKDHRGYTPLHESSTESTVEILEYLISQGADIHAQNRYGGTALDCAIKCLDETIKFENILEKTPADIERLHKVIDVLHRAMG